MHTYVTTGHIFTSRNIPMYYLYHIYVVLITPPIQLYTQIRIHVFHPGGNLIYLATPRQILWEPNHSLGPPKCREILSSTINLFSLCKNGRFQCQQQTQFLTMGVYIQNWSDIYCYLFQNIELGLIEKLRHSLFISW